MPAGLVVMRVATIRFVQKRNVIPLFGDAVNQWRGASECTTTLDVLRKSLVHSNLLYSGRRFACLSRTTA